MEDTKEAALKWIAEIAPGDEVILKGGWKNNPVGVLRVTKVTPTGIIRTEEKLSFQQVRWTSRFWVKGIADTHGEIVPYDDTLANEAREYQARIAAENMRKAKLNKAKTLCYELAYGKRQMTLALAETIIAACEKEGQKE